MRKKRKERKKNDENEEKRERLRERFGSIKKVEKYDVILQQENRQKEIMMTKTCDVEGGTLART